MPQYPLAPKRPHTITQHGMTRADDYFWLRQRKDPEVLKFLTAHMDYLEEVMGHTKPLQEELFSEMKHRIQETDSSVPEKRGDGWHYIRTEAGKQYPIYCRRKESLENPEEILLDQNQLAEGHDFCSVSGFQVSPDGKTLAYAVDFDGDETYTIRFKNLEDGSHYPEEIPNTLGSVYYPTGIEWANDSATIFYVTLDDSLRPFKLYRHTVGTDPAQDVLIFHEADEQFFLFFYKTRDGKWIITDHSSTLTTEERYLSADAPDGALKIIAPRRHGVEYYARHHNGRFFIITNENAKNFKLMAAALDNLNLDAWQEILPHRADTLIEFADTFANHLVVYERRNGLRHIRISDADGVSNVKYVNFPDPVYLAESDGNREFNTNMLRFKYSSLITPHTTVDLNMDTNEWNIKKVATINRFDKSDYVVERVFATAADGTQIPMSVAYKKSIKLDGGNPALMHGYGAYGAIIDADFIANRLSLLDRGFVFAIAHVRGGAEMGRAWYEGGKVLTKKNSFTDFIACAEHLIKHGYTSKDKLAIHGVSAGGLLVTSSMVLRPDLFKAVIAKVPFVDAINSISDPTIPLTTHEYDEWGNPAEYKEHFDYIMSYSPYDNLKATAYPHIMLTGGFHDPRVMYWEPAKFAAKLGELKTDDNLLLLKTNFHAGHAGSSGRYDLLKEVAFEYVFLIDRLQGNSHS